MSRAGLPGLLAPLLLAGCGSYREFTLPPQPGGNFQVRIAWRAQPEPVLTRGGPGAWDAVDVLNPSVMRWQSGYLNVYSGFDGKTWHSGLATSSDGLSWRKTGKILSPDQSGWQGGYIAANGSAIISGKSPLYFYQAGQPPRIGLLRLAVPGGTPQADEGLVLPLGPYASWDERGVADPYAVAIGGKLYLYYLGMDRARRQRLGVAVSGDGVRWYKLRTNPVLELGESGAFDENGLGEPAVWVSNGYYWMLYVGRDRGERRRLGLARSVDGVHWNKLPDVIAGDQSWDSKVLCDPSVLVEGDRIRVWFGGGDVARPDEFLHGQIGYAELTIHVQP